MSVQYGYRKLAKINSLVVNIDTDSSECFKGVPTTNIVGNPTFEGISGTRTSTVSPQSWFFSGGNVGTAFTFYNEGDAIIDLKYPKEGSVITNGPDPNSNRRIYVGINPLNPGEVYTWSAWVRFERAFQSGVSNFQYDSSNAFTGSGGYLTPFGQYAADNGYSLGEWFRYMVQITGATNSVRGIFGPVISSSTDLLMGIQRVQIEQKPYATPFVNGSRSNTNSLYNLVGKQSLDVSTTAFPTPNQLSFDGVTDYVHIPYPNTDLNGDPLFSVEGIFRRTDTFSVGGPWGIGGNGINQGICAYTVTSNKIGIDLWGRTTFHTGVDYPLNDYVHVVWVKKTTEFTTNSFDIYINGVKYTGNDFTIIRNNSSSVNLNTSTKGFCIGKIVHDNGLYQAPFDIPVFKIYKEVLTQEDVLNNYNAFRSRFNLP